eukprot:3493675-Pyramimonas_sp.AAC.1
MEPTRFSNSRTASVRLSFRSASSWAAIGLKGGGGPPGARGAEVAPASLLRRCTPVAAHAQSTE